jgi:hypothetical protein
MMWGDRSPRAKLTGDSRRGFEAVLIGDCRSFHSLARNWPLRPLRLLQQYLPSPEVDHFVGEFFLDYASRFYMQRPSRSRRLAMNDIALIVMRSHFLGVCFRIDVRKQT